VRILDQDGNQDTGRVELGKIIQPHPLIGGVFYYINDMRKQLNDLEVRIENLDKMLVSAIRYGEEDLQRMIRHKIEGLEREMKILKNKMS
jgi:hypothetical protein